jgi:phosphate/sulfate permease
MDSLRRVTPALTVERCAAVTAFEAASIAQCFEYFACVCRGCNIATTIDHGLCDMMSENPQAEKQYLYIVDNGCYVICKQFD